MLSRMGWLVVLGFAVFVPPSHAELAPQFVWQGNVSLPHLQPLEKSAPPACDICLQGEVNYQFLDDTTRVEMSAEYIVNYDEPGSSSGTLYLGFFLFPDELSSLTIDDINDFNFANAQLSTLGGESFFQNVNETAGLLSSPPDGDYYAYLFLGEVTDIVSVGVAEVPIVSVRDFVPLQPSNQPTCTVDACVVAFSAGGTSSSGGNSGGGFGGGFNGGGDFDERDPNKGEPITEPQSRRECTDRRRNRAAPDQATAQSGQTAFIDVKNNDDLNPEGTVAVLLDALPDHGSATVTGGSISYTPDAGFTGDDKLRYRLSSTCGLTSIAEVTIKVEAAPVIIPENCPADIRLPDELPALTENTTLLNVSTRGLVGNCDNTMRAGFIAETETTYFIRGRGPSFGAGGVPDTLIRVVGFEVQNNQLVEVELDSNDDWQDHATASCLVEGSQLEPTDARESALMITLPPGQYLAILESADADADCQAVYGNGIIEVNDMRLFPDDIQP